MTKIIAVLLIVFASLTGLGHAAEIPTNEQPMCGNRNVSPEAQRSNKAFVESISEPNRKLASNKAVYIGWRPLAATTWAKPCGGSTKAGCWTHTMDAYIGVLPSSCRLGTIICRHRSKYSTAPGNCCQTIRPSARLWTHIGRRRPI